MNLTAQFQKIKRALQLRVARDVSLGLSLFSICALISIAPAGVGLTNPKNWSSFFRVMAADGFFIHYTGFLVVGSLVFSALAVLFELLRRRYKSL